MQEVLLLLLGKASYVARLCGDCVYTNSCTAFSNKVNLKSHTVRQ